MARNTLIDFSNRTAIVTGASRGIGRAIAKKLAAYGASVVLAARNQDELSNAAKEIRTAGGNAKIVRCDVTRFQDVQAAVECCLVHFGCLDILVNNAGTIDPISRLTDSDPKIWEKAVDVNYKGVYFGLRAAIPVMIKQGTGIIVNISSGAANSALEGWSHYCSTKAAVKKLTECAHKEYGALGIRVVGLSPGTVSTEMMRKIKESGMNPVSKLNPSAHIPPEWAAEAVAFLCTDAGGEFAGTDFSIKTQAGRRRVGLDDTP